MSYFLIIGMTLIYFLLSYFVYRKFRFRRNWLFALIPIYFVIAYFYSGLIWYFHKILIGTNFQIDLGHAGEGAVLLLIINFLITIVFSVLIINRNKRS